MGEEGKFKQNDYIRVKFLSASILYDTESVL